MQNNGNGFNAADELVRLQLTRRISRRQRYQQSVLMKYRSELVELRICGATLADLRLWLRRQRVRVAISTISRFLRKVPEMQGE